ncbi:MAG: histidine kinase [Terrimicrobiaceae bacterium]
MKLSTQTVYSKALAIYVAMSFLLGLGVVSFTQAIIVREFRETERREMETSVERLQLMMERELQDVESALTDLLAESPALDAGLIRLPDLSQLESLQLNFVALVDAQGKLMASSILSDEQGSFHEADIPVIANGIRKAEVGKSADYAAAGNQLASIAWKESAGGMPEGTLLLAGRLFADQPVAFLENLLGGSLTFETLAGRTIGAAGTEDIVAMLAGNEIAVTDVSPEKISGAFVLKGLGTPLLGVVRLTQGRPLEVGAQTSVRIFLTVLALAGGLLFVAVWYLLDRTILKRIQKLTRLVEAEQAKGLLPVKLDFQGDDELGTLARRIEQLAVLLEKVQSQYQQVVQDQTEVICRFDETFQILFSNEVFRRTFPAPDKAHSEFLGDRLAAEAFEFIAHRFQRLYPTFSIDTFQHSIDFPEGRTIWFRSTLRRSFTADGQGSGGQWVAADVTLQVEAERGVQSSERQLRQLSSRLLHLQDEERRRIARELHDSTAQSLSALEMNVSLLDPIARDDRTKRIVAETRRIAQDCCQELRNISYLLHPPLLDEVGLPFAIQWFVDGFIERTGIVVELDVHTPFPRVNRDIETSLFRVIQEAASNIYRHSGASHASVALSYDRRQGIRMTIRDDGTGFASGPEGQTPPRMGIGLAGMRERIAQFNGTLEIKNSPTGVEVVISIPTASLHAQN